MKNLATTLKLVYYQSGEWKRWRQIINEFSFSLQSVSNHSGGRRELCSSFFKGVGMNARPRVNLVTLLTSHRWKNSNLGTQSTENSNYSFQTTCLGKWG